MSMEDQAAEIKAAPAVFEATIHITRAATGLTETYQIVGTPLPQEPSAAQGE